jgi:hypothetical protein
VYDNAVPVRPAQGTPSPEKLAFQSLSDMP